MNIHPGGDDLTIDLIRRAGLAPCRALDMGAGDGDTVRLLRTLGFDAVGIDTDPGPDVERGDLLDAPFADGEFDAAIAHCSFSASGDAARAFAEASRLLAPGGALLYSDVKDRTAEAAAKASGLEPTDEHDEAARWRSFLIEAAWRDVDICRGARCPADANGYVSIVFKKIK